MAHAGYISAGGKVLVPRSSGNMDGSKFQRCTLPETNSSPMKVTIFPSKYHQNGGFSMANC